MRYARELADGALRRRPPSPIGTDRLAELLRAVYSAGVRARSRRLAPVASPWRPGPDPEPSESKETRPHHARRAPRHLLPRHRDRPRDGQHAGPRPRPRDRHQRAERGRDRREDPEGPRDRRGGEADGRPDPGQHRRDPAAPRRGDQRLRRDGADDQVLRAPGARPDRPHPAAAHDPRRPVRCHRGGEARGPRRGAQRGRPLGAPHRGADGRGDRCRPAGIGADRAASSSTSAAARPRSP